ncbi:hypothetical protein ACLB2K_010918 [Fragaria x ananassa]
MTTMYLSMKSFDLVMSIVKEKECSLVMTELEIGRVEASTGATRDSSNLLAHEAAFAIGQMQDDEAIPALVAVLSDFSLHPIVHHVAAEALGAIDLESNVPLLKIVLLPIQLRR